jgi:hypothetical protein
MHSIGQRHSSQNWKPQRTHTGAHKACVSLRRFSNSVPVCVCLCTSRCDFITCALRWVSPSQVLVFGEASGLRTSASRFCFGAVQTQFECWDVQPLPWHLETEKSQSLIRILNCFSQAKSSSRFVKFVEIFTRSSTLPSVDPV